MLPFQLRHKHIRPDTYKKSLRRHKGVIMENGELLANEIFSGAISEEMSKMYKAFFLTYTTNNLRHLDSSAKIDLLQDEITQTNGKLRNQAVINRVARGGQARRLKNFCVARHRFNRNRLGDMNGRQPSQNEIRRSMGKQRWTKAQKTSRNGENERCKTWYVYIYSYCLSTN